MTGTEPLSTLIASCTVTTIFVIVIIYSWEFQWLELTPVNPPTVNEFSLLALLCWIVSSEGRFKLCQMFGNQFSSLIHFILLGNITASIHTRNWTWGITFYICWSSLCCPSFSSVPPTILLQQYPCHGSHHQCQRLPFSESLVTKIVHCEIH